MFILSNSIFMFLVNSIITWDTNFTKHNFANGVNYIDLFIFLFEHTMF